MAEEAVVVVAMVAPHRMLLCSLGNHPDHPLHFLDPIRVSSFDFLPAKVANFDLS